MCLLKNHMQLRVSSIKTTGLFVLILCFQITIAVFLNLLDLDFGQENSSLDEYPIFFKIIILILIAPLLETAIFNVLPIKLLQFLFKNKLIIILSASIVFSLIHYYSWVYMLMTYIGGVGLNMFYILTEEKKGGFASFGWTALLHSSYNLIGFILIDIFEIL